MGYPLPGDVGGSAAGAADRYAPGSRLAGYRLEEQIGRGGMAVAFRARDERLDRVVALKILAPSLAADEAFRQRFIRESQAAAAVDDPHIIPVYEAGEADGVLYIAMRYVPGGDLRSLVRRDGPLIPARAASITWQVASALDSAHAAGLVHRDVKPANMLVDVRPGQADHVYLADFGLSKRTQSTSGLTETGQFLGTIDYISPEQIQGQPTDGRTDQYALACSAYELLCGQPPFHRDEAMAVMYAQLRESAPPLTTHRRDLPPAVDQVFARGLAKAPGHRFPSCREFAYALLQALGQAPQRPAPAAPGRPPTWAPPSSPPRGGTPGPMPGGPGPRGSGPTGAVPRGPVPARPGMGTAMPGSAAPRGAGLRGPVVGGPVAGGPGIGSPVAGGPRMAGGPVRGGAGPGGAMPRTGMPGGPGPGGVPRGAGPAGSGPRGPVPGSPVPGRQMPGSQMQGRQMPGSQMPGSQVPGSQVPGSQVPGSWGPAMPGGPGYGPGGYFPQRPPVPRRPWTRDWTAWTLIIAIPVTVFALSIVNLGAAGSGLGGALFLVVLVAVPTALIGKLVRRMRRQT